MFSLDKFYNILHNNLIAPLHYTGRSVYFYPFGTYQQTLQLHNSFEPTYQPDGLINIHAEKSAVHCYFFDQEPLYDYTLPIVKNALIFSSNSQYPLPRYLGILANSEKSDIKKQCLRENNLQDWYYFYHGFAALDWYRDFQYVRPNSFNRFNKVFMCYNHLISEYRSYRLHLVSNLLEQDLVKYGSVSLSLADSTGTWQDAIESPVNPLDSRARVKIYHALKQLNAPLVADTPKVNGAYSANLNIDHLTDALFHIVTETVFYQNKLHLTEKVFKPIVAKRPFILAGAVGNLEYLRGYGFKTFGQWIDESYDTESDNYLRIEMITVEVNKLCLMSKNQLNEMYADMQETLEYNHRHFYTTFKQLIVNELVDNFNGILTKFNNGRQPGNHSRYHHRFEFEPGHLDSVKQQLLS
jgi:hypothetical protein